MKRLTVAALTLMFIASATATQIEVQPSQYSFDMTAGDMYSQDLQVTWNGNNPTALTASTNIEAENTDSEGFNISYSDNPIAFLSGETRNIQVKIDSSEALKASNYTFSTEFSTSVTVDDNDGGGGGGTDYVYRTKEVGDLNESQEKQLKEKVNETVDQNLKLQKELEALTERLQKLNTSDSNENPETNQSNNQTTETKPDTENTSRPVIEKLLVGGSMIVLITALFYWLAGKTVGDTE